MHLAVFGFGKGVGAVISVPYNDDFQVIEDDTQLMPAACRRLLTSNGSPEKSTNLSIDTYGYTHVWYMYISTYAYAAYNLTGLHTSWLS